MVSAFRQVGRLVTVRWGIAVAMCVALMACFFSGTFSAYAATKVDALPFVNNFATARFKTLATVELGGNKAYAYGGGETVLPDRTSLWIGMTGEDELSYVIKVGSTIYSRTGSEPWQKDEDAAAPEALPVSAQFNILQELATSITYMGDEAVNGTPTGHYQVWINGSDLLQDQDLTGLSDEDQELLSKISLKYDFWVSTTDKFLYQQNSVVSIPETTVNGTDIPAISTSELTTFYDINNPNISVNAPE